MKIIHSTLHLTVRPGSVHNALKCPQKTKIKTKRSGHLTSEFFLKAIVMASTTRVAPGGHLRQGRQCGERVQTRFKSSAVH